MTFTFLRRKKQNKKNIYPALSWYHHVAGKGPSLLVFFSTNSFSPFKCPQPQFLFFIFLVGEGRCLKVKAETLRWQSCGSLLKSLTPRLREAKSCFKRLSIFLARVLRAQRVRVFKHFSSTFASLGLLQLLNCCGFLSLEFKLSVCSEKSKKLDVCFIKPNTHTKKKKNPDYIMFLFEFICIFFPPQDFLVANVKCHVPSP